MQSIITRIKDCELDETIDYSCPKCCMGVEVEYRCIEDETTVGEVQEKREFMHNLYRYPPSKKSKVFQCQNCGQIGVFVYPNKFTILIDE